MGLATRAKAFLAGLVPYRGSTGLPWLGNRIEVGHAMFDSVSNEHVLGLTAAYRACSIYADVVSTQPPAIWSDELTGGRKRIRSTAASWALATLRQDDAELAAWDACFYGNGYIKIFRDGTGAPYELRAVPNRRVMVEIRQSDSAVFYRIAADDILGEREEVLPEADMIHFKFRTVGGNRLEGVSPIASCSPAFAHALKARDAQRSVFDNLSYVSGVLQTEQKMDPEVGKQTQARWEQAYSQGTGGLGKVAILSNGLEWKPFTLKAVDAELLQAIKATDLDIARAFGLPFQFLGAGENITFASASEGTRSLIVQSLRPFASRMADAISVKLLTRNERARGTTVEYDLEALLLPPGQEQATYVTQMVAAGVMTPNEARNQFLRLPDIADGDKLRGPAAPAPAAAPASEPAAPAPAAKPRPPKKDADEVVREMVQVERTEQIDAERRDSALRIVEAQRAQKEVELELERARAETLRAETERAQANAAFHVEQQKTSQMALANRIEMHRLDSIMWEEERLKRNATALNGILGNAP